MTDPKWIFWGMSAQDLIFAAGQFTLLVASFMLAAKHVVWFWRGRHHRERRHLRTVRAWVELVVGAVLAVMYAQQIYLNGASERLDTIEAVVQIWLFAVLLMALVVARRDEVPPA